MLTKFEHYCDKEYNEMANYLADCKLKPTLAINYIDGAIKHCLGVAFFIQMECGCEFKEVDIIYDKYRKKFEKLIDTYK